MYSYDATFDFFVERFLLSLIWYFRCLYTSLQSPNRKHHELFTETVQLKQHRQRKGNNKVGDDAKCWNVKTIKIVKSTRNGLSEGPHQPRWYFYLIISQLKGYCDVQKYFHQWYQAFTFHLDRTGNSCFFPRSNIYHSSLVTLWLIWEIVVEYNQTIMEKFHLRELNTLVYN